MPVQDSFKFGVINELKEAKKALLKKRKTNKHKCFNAPLKSRLLCL